MTPTAPNSTFLFDRIIVSLAIVGPILMVIVAGVMPEGSRGTLIVTGHEFLAAILGLALLLRIVYGIGFYDAYQRLRDGQRVSVTA